MGMARLKRSIESSFALLDVKGGRETLLQRLSAGDRVEVVIRGVIDPDKGSHGRDDGTSIEFSVLVSSVEEV